MPHPRREGLPDAADYLRQLARALDTAAGQPSIQLLALAAIAAAADESTWLLDDIRSGLDDIRRDLSELSVSVMAIANSMP